MVASSEGMLVRLVMTGLDHDVWNDRVQRMAFLNGLHLANRASRSKKNSSTQNMHDIEAPSQCH
jgi:hypothetical protein